MVNITKCPYGQMMYLPNDKFLGESFHLYGEAHHHEVEVLKTFIKEGDVVLDIGANIGCITVPLAQHVGKSGQVISIEPQQFIYNMLCGNIALNMLTNVATFNRAAAHKSGIEAFIPDLDYTKDINFGGVECACEAGFLDDSGKSIDKVVQTIAVDDLRLSRCNLLKVDVEGMEPVVLQGAVDTIRRCKPIIQVEAIHNIEEISRFLDSVGYDYVMQEHSLFNKDNFNKIEQDIMVSPDGKRYVSKDFIGWPSGQEPASYNKTLGKFSV